MIVRCDSISWIDHECEPVSLHTVWQFSLHGSDHQGIPDGSSALKLSEVIQGLFYSLN